MNRDLTARAGWQLYAVVLVFATLWALHQLLAWAHQVLYGYQIWPNLGLLVALLLVIVQRHPRRSLAFISLGAFGLAPVLGMLSLGVEPTPVVSALAGFMVGVMLLGAINAFRILCPRHWLYPVLFVVVWCTVPTLLVWATLEFFWSDDEIWMHHTFFPILFVLTTIGFGFSAWLLFREILELLLELLMWPIYRVKGYGPGLKEIPRRGSVIVVANHSAWFDPLWLAKVLPRRLIPMMTSMFYDLPILRWLMVYGAHAIRVQVSGFRRDVPELKEAVAALERGECLVVFPEGSMRRTEERPLRQFGQGIWHILKERPETPVIACWIEGGWGCYFSYWNGPPTKNKRFDFWRRIEIGVAAPQVIDPSLLAEHRALRTYLMKACLEARGHLGKKPYQLEERPAIAEDEV